VAEVRRSLNKDRCCDQIFTVARNPAQAHQPAVDPLSVRLNAASGACQGAIPMRRTQRGSPIWSGAGLTAKSFVPGPGSAGNAQVFALPLQSQREPSGRAQPDAEASENGQHQGGERDKRLSGGAMLQTLIEGRARYLVQRRASLLRPETTRRNGSHGRALLVTGTAHVRWAQIRVVETGIIAAGIVTHPMVPSNVHV
jgi:hypothetical protein